MKSGKFALLLLCVTVPFLLGFATLLAEALPAHQALGLAVFGTTVSLWFTEALPIPATALLVPVLLVVFGVQDATAAFVPFGNPIIFLFIGAFLLAKAMQKHGWDKRMAYFVLASRMSGSSILQVGLGLGAMSFVLSMWISNTATVAMLTPLVLGLVGTLQKEAGLSEREFSGVAAFYLLLVAYASSIGGIATPVGTPPNLITLGFLKEHGLHIGFFEWMVFALPLAVTMFLLAALLLAKSTKFPAVPREAFTSSKQQASTMLGALGPLRIAELQLALVFGITVVLWLAPGIAGIVWPEQPFTEWLEQRLPMATVALGAGVLLFFLPVGSDGERNLEWRDAQDIDWGTVILFGGGLCLGNMLHDTGLAELVGSSLFGSVAGTPLMLTIAAVVVALVLTEVASNTASASILVSILLGLVPEGAPASAFIPVLCACITTSYGFMLPVATPPNAIVFGTGKVPYRTMIRRGGMLNLLGVVVVILLIGVLRLPLLVLGQ